MQEGEAWSPSLFTASGHSKAGVQTGKERVKEAHALGLC